jgi:hypothetical protein
MIGSRQPESQNRCLNPPIIATKGFKQPLQSHRGSQNLKKGDRSPHPTTHNYKTGIGIPCQSHPASQNSNHLGVRTPTQIHPTKGYLLKVGMT